MAWMGGGGAGESGRGTGAGRQQESKAAAESRQDSGPASAAAPHAAAPTFHARGPLDLHRPSNPSTHLMRLLPKAKGTSALPSTCRGHHLRSIEANSSTEHHRRSAWGTSESSAPQVSHSATVPTAPVGRSRHYPRGSLAGTGAAPALHHCHPAPPVGRWAGAGGQRGGARVGTGASVEARKQRQQQHADCKKGVCSQQQCTASPCPGQLGFSPPGR